MLPRTEPTPLLGLVWVIVKSKVAEFGTDGSGGATAGDETENEPKVLFPGGGPPYRLVTDVPAKVMDITLPWLSSNNTVVPKGAQFTKVLQLNEPEVEKSMFVADAMPTSMSAATASRTILFILK